MNKVYIDVDTGEDLDFNQEHKKMDVKLKIESIKKHISDFSDLEEIDDKLENNDDYYLVDEDKYENIMRNNYLGGVYTMADLTRLLTNPRERCVVFIIEYNNKYIYMDGKWRILLKRNCNISDYRKKILDLANKINTSLSELESMVNIETSENNDNTDYLISDDIHENAERIKRIINTLDPYVIRGLFDLSNETSITLAEFKNLLKREIYHNAFVGKTIYINNREYLILSTDKKSYDLICIEPIEVDIPFSEKDNIYKTSEVRIWLNTTYIRKYIDEDLYPYMIRQDVESNGEILNDYVKIPSMTELGKSNEYYDMVIEGKRYDLLNQNIFRKNICLRTRNTNRSSNVWYINRNGNASYISYSSSCGLTPIIRLQ